jgi:hypothetical protein
VTRLGDGLGDNEAATTRQQKPDSDSDALLEPATKQGTTEDPWI